eukprot:COSAG04_NODE_5170_length_1714_cov_1.858824_3_plen_25_part_01
MGGGGGGENTREGIFASWFLGVSGG